VPPVDNEREGLLAYLAQQRDAVRISAYGLTDDEARLTPTAGTLSIGGLVKHLSNMERGWMDIILQRRGEAGQEDYEANFRLGTDETLAGALEDYRDTADATAAIVAGIADLAKAVPVPRDQPWFPRDVESWSVRWVLLHLIEETARHAGHADIVREAIDGATFYPQIAAAEGWQASAWLQPWEPKARADQLVS